MKRQSFLHGSLLLSSSALLAKLLGAMFKIPLTSLLGGTGMGYFSTAYGLFLPLYALLVTGLSTAVARMVADCAAGGDFAGAVRIRSVARRVFFWTGLAGTAAAILCAGQFTLSTAGGMEGYPAVLAIAPAVLFCCLTAVERGYYEGLCSMTPTALSQTAEALTKLVCGLWLCRIALTCPELPSCLARFGREGAAAAAAVLGVTLSTFVGYLCTLLYGLHREKTVPSAPSCLHSGSILRSLFAIMVPVALGSLVTNLTALIDLTTVMRMFGKMISTDSVAFYRGAMLSESISPEKAAAFAYGSFMGLSVTVFNLVPSVTNMFAKGVLPCTAQAWARGDRREAASLAGQVLVLTAMVAVPAGCGIFALSREVLAFLFAGRETEITVAYSSLKWLMPGLVCLCLTFPVFSLLQAMGRADLPVKLMVPGVVLKLLGNLLLIPVFYTAGAALSTSICYGVILLLSLFGLRRVLGEGLHICKTICCILYAGILCGGAAYLCYGIAIGYFPQRIAFLAAVLTGGAVYVLTLFLLRRTLDIRKIRSCSV